MLLHKNLIIQGAQPIMLPRSTDVSDSLRAYMYTNGIREDSIVKALGDETAQLPNADWATPPEQGALLQMLVRLIQARRVIEIGTFTGYAALAMALALPDDGELITCDIAEGWSEMGTHYWREAGVNKRIQRRLGDAKTILAELRDAGGRNAYDMIFLDANSSNYPGYLELAAELLRSGGLLVANDVFRGGAVADDDLPHSRGASGVRAFNVGLRDDARFDICMLAIADGMTLARKK